MDANLISRIESFTKVSSKGLKEYQQPTKKY
ncbi:hypothetical protein ABH966_005194 [Lysinibacillus sp. RC46]